MALRLPSEIVVERFLPTVRAVLAEELHDRGLTQQEIADHLGLTQAAVSKQLHGETVREPRFVDDPDFQATMAVLADGMASGTVGEFERLSTLVDLVRTFVDRGPICDLHEEAMPSLRGLGCDLCVRGLDDERLAEREILSIVRRAARLLRSEPAVAGFVPHVGTNVGMTRPGGSVTADVAAIPGRIYETRGRVVVPADPEFGSSEHVATTVLAAHAAHPRIRAAVNLVTDDRLLAAARARGHDPVEFEPGYEDRYRRLHSLFDRHDDPPRIVFHRGAFGIEPITYVLGETAIDAVEVALRLVREATATE